MRKFRHAVLAATAAALVALLLVGSGLSTRTANGQEKTAQINYAPVPGGEYKIDPAHSIIGFAIRHLEINWVEGRFKDFTGTIRFDDKDVTKSSVEFAAQVESIDTGVAPRDKHLRTADFFDAAKYPEITFKSTRIERKGRDGYVLLGDLTLKGVTKQAALPFTVTGAIKDPWGNTRFGVEAHTKINRRDFGVNYSHALPAGGFDVGNEVTINLQFEAVQPAAKPAGQ